jgi:hypothetical protein
MLIVILAQLVALRSSSFRREKRYEGDWIEGRMGYMLYLHWKRFMTMTDKTLRLVFYFPSVSR